MADGNNKWDYGYMSATEYGIAKCLVKHFKKMSKNNDTLLERGEIINEDERFRSHFKNIPLKRKMISMRHAKWVGTVQCGDDNRDSMFLTPNDFDLVKKK